VVERHRFLLLELDECYGNYLMRRDQMTDAVDQLKHLQSATADINTSTISKIVSLTHTHSLSLLSLSDFVSVSVYQLQAKAVFTVTTALMLH